MAVSAEKIKEHVQEHIRWDDRVDDSDIHVKVENGVVTLTGAVPNFIARRAAEMDAQSIPGVARVNNHLAIRYSAAMVVPSDSDLLTHIRNAFIWNPNIDPNKIDILVDNRNVTLRGAVDAYWKKRLAEDLVFDLSGVLSVINELVVVPTGDYMDESIANAIMSALDRRNDIDATLIDVSVSNGKVQLNGKVPDWNAFLVVQNTVEVTPGVTDITNHLSVGL